MQKFFYLLSFVMIGMAAQAQRPPIMVCNPAGTTCAPYFTLDSAYANANAGDFIYLPGGHFTLTDTVEKEIHLYGAGSDVDSTQATGRTTIDGSINISTGSSHSHFEGFIGSIVAHTVVQDITVKRCQITFSCVNEAHIDNSLFIHNIIGGYSLGANASFQGNGNLIQNCLITGGGSGLTYSTIKNCIITGYHDSANGYGGGGCRSCSVLYQATYNTIENCVMYCGLAEACAPNMGSTQGLPVSNNYIHNTVVREMNVWGSVIAPLSGASETSNVSVIENAAPLFAEDSYYEISPLSSAYQGGADGTDMGIHGGELPWVLGVVPSNPHIYFQQISGATNAQGDLPVIIKMRSGDQ